MLIINLRVSHRSMSTHSSYINVSILKTKIIKMYWITTLWWNSNLMTIRLNYSLSKHNFCSPLPLSNTLAINRPSIQLDTYLQRCLRDNFISFHQIQTTTNWKLSISLKTNNLQIQQYRHSLIWTLNLSLNLKNHPSQFRSTLLWRSKIQGVRRVFA